VLFDKIAAIYFKISEKDIYILKVKFCFFVFFFAITFCGEIKLCKFIF